ncbi:MAG: isopenicillin-N epimerase [Phycisphaerae bacterium]|nr:MAG: isopenicillin-N epimerase [Phycisphaerae bacterium]
MTRSLPPPSPLASHWDHEHDVVYLNHGSFGSCPRAVLEEQTQQRAQMERELVRHYVTRHEGLMDHARHALARFVRCDQGGLALLPNASIAVATVLSNVRLEPGDEILMNAQEYPACQNSVRRAAARAGASVTYADVPFPIRDSAQVVSAYEAKVTPRTRLALVSHVTSPTGLVLPVERVVASLQARGVDVLVDGAHAPGMIPTLDLGALRPAYYTANCHKWVCSPKGSAFLYVRDDRREAFRPLVLSNNAEKPKPGRSQFLTEFDYVGTQDYTALYSIPKAIEVMADLGGGWPAVMTHNHDLCVRARGMLCESLGVEAPAPESMIGSIATIVLPPHDEARRVRLAARPTAYHDALQDALLANWGIQVPVWGLAGKPERFVRISTQVYNSRAQYEYLAKALRTELDAEARL